jgi:DNA topoisomerase-1
MNRAKLTLDAVTSARTARLRYVNDQKPGIRRQRRGEGFHYIAPNGKILRNPRQLGRIRQLAIPPAWTDVWICPFANGHLQATGRDTRGRKQYRYHADWRTVRDETKFDRLIEFAEALPKIRRRVARDLRRTALPREKVLATIVRLMEGTQIRIGNDEYARDNNSFGLTTMRNRHVKVAGRLLRCRFRGKSGKIRCVSIESPRLARIVRRCRELPGYELFQYVHDDGTVRRVVSEDVNDYLRDVTGADFTAKHFRTWAGTVHAAAVLSRPCNQKRTQKNLLAAIDEVASVLGNTRSVCRKFYIHPDVAASYLDGTMREWFYVKSDGVSKYALTPEEAAVVRLLRRWTHRRRRPLVEKLVPKKDQL